MYVLNSNADIIRGPGTRLGELSIPCDEFLNQALQFLKADHNRKVQVIPFVMIDLLHYIQTQW